MTRSLGIDVGATIIRVAEIESHGRGRKLVGLYEIVREEGVPAGILLHNFFESSGVTGERIGVGTGSHPLILRSFELPFGNTKKVESAIRAEFEDSLPFDISNHVLEIRPMGRIGTVFRFLGGLIPADALRDMDQLCDEAGIIVNSYFPDTEALAQLALNQCLPAGTTTSAYAVCDLGYGTTKISFLRGARPKFLNRKAKEPIPAEVLEMRTINRGGRELIQWIREKNVLSVDEAVQWLIHRAEIQPGTVKKASLTMDISDEIKTALRPIIVELYQTLQSFKSRTGEAPFAVYLTGGLTGLKGLREFLTAELRVPFHAWPIFEGFDTVGLPLTIEKERTFAVALAIAHRWSYTPGGGWLNLKRMTAQKKILSSFIANFARPELKHVLTGLAIAAACVIGYNSLSGFLLSKQESTVQNDLTLEFRKLDKDLEKRAKKFVRDPEHENDLFQTERKKRLANEAGKSGGVPNSRARSEILLDVSEVLPAGAILKDIVINETGAQGLTLQSDFRVSSAPTPDQLKKTLDTVSQSLRGRGYADIALEMLPGDRSQLVLKAKWKGLQK